MTASPDKILQYSKLLQYLVDSNKVLCAVLICGKTREGSAMYF